MVRIKDLNQTFSPVVVVVHLAPEGLEDGEEVISVVWGHEEMGEVTWLVG